MEVFDKVPEGWYEKEYQTIVPINDNICLFRSNNGSLIQYQLNIDGIITIIPRNFYEAVARKYKEFKTIRYKYLFEDYSTHTIIEDITNKCIYALDLRQ